MIGSSEWSPLYQFALTISGTPAMIHYDRAVLAWRNSGGFATSEGGAGRSNI